MKLTHPRILLVRTAWMKYYEGRANNDPPMSGAKYIKENKTGGEIYNFKSRNGKVLGYIPNIGNLDIDKLGAKSSDKNIKNVIVVFCATHPVEKGMRVVGWYKNATVFRHPQDNSFTWGHHIVAVNSMSKRIDFNNRFCNIPNTFGRSALFYFSYHPEKANTLNKILNYIESDGTLLYPVKTKKVGKSSRQNDINKRLKVEKRAIDLATKYYSDRYGINNIKSVEKDNVGWDLEINTGVVILKVEVKGLSGNQLIVELTPNEFKSFDSGSDKYKLFVVTNALLKKTNFQIFSYQRKGNIWVGNDGSELNINRIMSARISLK
ncbi:MAG TPA: DUF3883 domain-containing protein [Bacteroidia bacterium]|nr:DUF3883 domain-containing protein [Bacteroidia bacterium]